MRGFTLLEILIVSVIMVFLISGIFIVLNMGEKTWIYDAGLLDLQQEARSAMDGMVRELRQGNISSIVITAIDTNSTRINFTIPCTSSPAGCNVGYYLDSNSSIIRENPNGSNCPTTWDNNYCKILANNINYLVFNYSNDTKILEVKLKAEKSARGRKVYYPLKDNSSDPNEIRLLKEQVKLRNKN